MKIPVYHPQGLEFSDFRENPDTDAAIRTWAWFLYARAPYMVCNSIVPGGDGPTEEAQRLVEEIRRLDKLAKGQAGESHD